MLEELSISALGVIDAATVELAPGLNVVTGETGAGKTMVVTALGLLLGGRADATIVRPEAARARVEGRVLVPPDGPVAGAVAELGADLDGDALILSRTISREGRSRAHAGGTGVPAGTLAGLAAELVVIHGQADQQQLLRPGRQRDLLDSFAGDELRRVRDDHRASFDALRAVETELRDIARRGRERAQETDLLTFGLTEIEAVDPQPGEDVALREEASRLGHVDGLRRAAEEAREALTGDDAAVDQATALGLVASARHSLDAERDHDPRMAELADQLASASYTLTEVAADLASYASSLDIDPVRLQWVQDRRAALGALLRKYGDSVAAVLDWSRDATARLAELDRGEERISELQAEQARQRERVTSSSGTLTGLRAAAAELLGAAVTAELAGLAMPHTRFGISLQAAGQPGRDGADEVAFELSTDGGEQRALARTASGGELSRVMLALEVCLAGNRPVPTMIFDEVDAGVGGKAAVEIGRRLSRLARRTQVIVVTHLPQVAAFADRHYLVQKTHAGSVTSSGVVALDALGRRTELSRMLAGLEGSATALAHAEELLAMADQDRASDHEHAAVG